MRSNVHAILLFCFLSAPLEGETLSRRGAELFASALIHRDLALDAWFDGEALSESRRLGIVYDGVAHKQLIGYDFDDATRDSIVTGRLPYTVSVDTIHDGYSRVVVALPRNGEKREFYFHGTACISPLAYFAQGWRVRESRHFRFFLSDTALFNDYCVRRLEKFLELMSMELRLSGEELHLLTLRKISYYLCSSEEQVRQLTGFQARGMYNLAYDAVISTYGTHEHELAHLLVNYKLRHLPLYAHPMLQEGIAVAFGGRGGMAAPVLLTLGAFLFQSGAVDLASLCDREEFGQIDPSLSYPAAGLYNRFLFRQLGVERYLALYRTHCGPAGSLDVTRIAPGELPSGGEWSAYLSKSAGMQPIGFDSCSSGARPFYADGRSSVTGDGEKYYFRLHDHMRIPGEARLRRYTSSLFRQLYPGEVYAGEEYLVRADSLEVAVYNLFTNSMIAHYAASFAIPPAVVPRSGDTYLFHVQTSALNEPLVPRQGPAWKLILSSDRDVYFHGLSFPDTLHGWAVGDSGTILRTADGGDSWESLKSGISQAINCVCFVDSVHGWAGTVGNSVGRTTDGGRTWIWQQSAGDSRRVCTAIAFFSLREGWAADNMSGIRHTADGGISWTEQSGPGAAFGIHMLDAREGWAIGIKRVVFHTTNGGADWVPLYPDTLRCGRRFTLESTTVYARDSSVWVGTTSSASSNSMARASIFASRDGGKTWACQWYPGVTFVHAVSFIDRNEGWAATNIGLLHTMDGGGLWTMHTPLDHVSMVGLCLVDRTHGWGLSFAGDMYRFGGR